MQQSALPQNMKIQSLSNDLIRQMKNVSELLPGNTRIEVVNNYTRKLRRSGYGFKQTRRIIVSGLTGYERILRLEKTGKGKVHRSAKSSLKSRYKKKLLGKTTWFLQGKKEVSEEEENISKEPARFSNKENKEKVKPDVVKENKDNKKEQEIATVLFVPQTERGELANRLRAVEKELSKLCGNRVKIVEKAGMSLKSVLVKPNPWANIHCGRQQCLPCADEKSQGMCKFRSITYETSCRPCREVHQKEKIYIGESARSAFERGNEHLNDYKVKKEDSHMFKHFCDEHSSEVTRPEFKMRVLKCHKTPLYRQVHEAILIAQNEPITLNAKNEYNRCLLPRLSVMIGEHENRKDEKARDKQYADATEYSMEKEDKRKRDVLRRKEGVKKRRLNSTYGQGVALHQPHKRVSLSDTTVERTPGKRKAGEEDRIVNERRNRQKTNDSTLSTVRKFLTSRNQVEKSTPSSKSKNDQNSASNTIQRTPDAIPNVASVQEKITKFEEIFSKTAKPTQSTKNESNNAIKPKENQAKLKLKQKVGWKKPIPRTKAVKSSAAPPPISTQQNSIRQYLTTTQPPTEARAALLPPNKLKLTQPPAEQRKSPRITKLLGRFEDQGGT